MKSMPPFCVTRKPPSPASSAAFAPPPTSATRVMRPLARSMRSTAPSATAVHTSDAGRVDVAGHQTGPSPNRIPVATTSLSTPPSTMVASVLAHVHPPPAHGRRRLLRWPARVAARTGRDRHGRWRRDRAGDLGAVRAGRARVSCSRRRRAARRGDRRGGPRRRRARSPWSPTCASPTTSNVPSPPRGGVRHDRRAGEQRRALRGSRTPFAEQDRDDWLELYRINLEHVFSCTQAVLPTMIGAGRRLDRERLHRRGLPRDPGHAGVLGVQERESARSRAASPSTWAQRHPGERDRARPHRDAPGALLAVGEARGRGDDPGLGAGRPLRHPARPRRRGALPRVGPLGVRHRHDGACRRRQPRSGWLVPRDDGAWTNRPRPARRVDPMRSVVLLAGTASRPGTPKDAGKVRPTRHSRTRRAAGARPPPPPSPARAPCGRDVGPVAGATHCRAARPPGHRGRSTPHGASVTPVTGPA